MRAASLLVPVSAAALLACGDGDGGPGGGGACSGQSACRAGLVCVAGTCLERAPAVAACSPPTVPALSVGPPMTTPDPAGACLTPVRESVAPERTELLGAHRVGQTLAFEVPPNTWSVTIVSQEVGDSAVDEIDFVGFRLPNSVVPTNVRAPAPDGREFYTDTPAAIPEDANQYPDFTGFLAYYGGFTPTSSALTFPNTSRGLDVVRSAGALPAGTWQLTVNDFAFECGGIAGCSGGSALGEYDVRVIRRPGPIASTGTLDVDVYVASERFDAAGAAASADVARMFRTFSTVLANAGICVGAVAFHDLPAWADRYRSVAVDGAIPCDDLSQLFTLAVAPRPSVHLFLVDELTVSEPDGDFLVVGIDGSIPGPSGVPGTINGGAIVPLYDLGEGACGGAVHPGGCGSDQLGFIAAHETAHWLGLYHTTERSGTLFDPLSDTPTCACRACAPLAERATCAENEPEGEPTSMTGERCAGSAATCGGAANLMFWLLDARLSTGALSPEQGEVMRLNPAVR